MTDTSTARPVLRLGTRASRLATTQSETVAALLRERLGREVELVEISTEGDRDRVAPLAQLGGTGVFVSALRDALVDGRIDVAVHSLKDLPTEPHPQLTLAATPRREDPRDVVVTRTGVTLGELAPGSRVGTGSPRRAAQLGALGLGLDVADIRGNVDTRLRKVHDGEYDAVVLARAGLARLGLLEQVSEVLDPLQMLPAPGQGALAVETADPDLARALAVLDDPATRSAVSAERAALRALEAGCTAPVGALAEIAEGEDGEELWLRVVVLSHDGAVDVRRSITGPPAEAERLGTDLARAMLDEGVAELMNTTSGKLQQG